MLFRWLYVQIKMGILHALMKQSKPQMLVLLNSTQIRDVENKSSNFPGMLSKFITFWCRNLRNEKRKLISYKIILLILRCWNHLH